MASIVARLAPLAALALAASAAAAQDAPPLVATPTEQPAPKKKRPDRNEIARDQIQQGSFGNAYEIVQKLKGEWLRSQGAGSMRGSGSQLLVYLDDARLGGVDALRSITPESIQYIHFYNGSEATSKWGMDHASGVILVSTRAK